MKSQYDEKTTEAMEAKVDFYEYLFQNVIAGVRYCVSGRVIWNNAFDREHFGVVEGDAAAYIDEEWLKENVVSQDLPLIRNKEKCLNDQENPCRIFLTTEKDREGNWRKVAVSQTRVYHGDCPVDISMTIDASDKLAQFTKLESIWTENARLKNQIKIASLTTREKEILSLIAKGMGSKQIAETLFISFHTVESHRKNIMMKTKSHNHNQLVQIATACGI